jgi:hypothetical protein
LIKEHGQSADSDIAIVMQGLPVYENDFTLESLRLYKELFRDACIILSTWTDVPDKFVKDVQALEVMVLLNEKPEFTGVSNINLQVVSTNAGLRVAAEKGIKYVIKTRTDQRIYGGKTGSFLKKLLELFPYSAAGKHNRIIACSLNTYCNRLYSVSDMFQFGFTEDLFHFWNIQLQSLGTLINDQPRFEADVTFTFEKIPEVYLMVHYMDKINFPVKWTLENYQELLRDYFCIIDKPVLDIFWPKYSANTNTGQYYSSTAGLVEFGFRDWLLLQEQK